MHVAYIRVSTADQNEERQIEGMKGFPIEKFFMEKISGKNTNRPEFQRMLEFVREGDVVHVHDFSRLARSTKDLLDIVEMLKRKGVKLVSNKENENVDFTTPTGKLMLTMLGAISEFERENLLERQREGIEIAKREGKYKNNHGQKKHVDGFTEVLERIEAGTITKVEAARQLEISRPTLDRMIRDARALSTSI